MTESKEIASYAAMACVLERLDVATVEIEGIDPDCWKEILEGSLPNKEETAYLVMFFKHKYLPGFFTQSVDWIRPLPIYFRTDPDKPCFYCNTRPGELLCDGPSKTGTCDRPMCATCCPMPFEGPYHFCKKCCPKCFCGAFALVPCQAAELIELVFSSIGLQNPMSCEELRCNTHMSYVLDPRSDAKPGALLALCSSCCARLQLPKGTAEDPVKLANTPKPGKQPRRPSKPNQLFPPKPPVSRPALTLLPAPQETE